MKQSGDYLKPEVVDFVKGEIGEWGDIGPVQGLRYQIEFPKGPTQTFQVRLIG